MKYKVKLSYPTALELSGKTYLLFPQADVNLPDAEIVMTYLGLGYLEPLAVNENEADTKNKGKGDKK